LANDPLCFIIAVDFNAGLGEEGLEVAVYGTQREVIRPNWKAAGCGLVMNEQPTAGSQ